MKILAARSGDAPVFMAISSSSRLKIGTRNLSVIFKQSLISTRVTDHGAATTGESPDQVIKDGR